MSLSHHFNVKVIGGHFAYVLISQNENKCELSLNSRHQSRDFSYKACQNSDRITLNGTQTLFGPIILQNNIKFHDHMNECFVACVMSCKFPSTRDNIKFYTCILRSMNERGVCV